MVVSDEKVGEQQLISKWFGEFGLRNSAEEVSVVLLTDSESAVSSMVANVQGYQFLVQKAPPQAHESVGTRREGNQRCEGSSEDATP